MMLPRRMLRFASYLIFFPMVGMLQFAHAAGQRDIDGDGKDDLIVFHQGTQNVYPAAQQSSLEDITISLQCGSPGDIPVVGNYSAEEGNELAAYNPSFGLWQICSSKAGGSSAQFWGEPGDIPVPGDYNGDGLVDFSVYRPTSGQWWTMNNPSGTDPGRTSVVTFGEKGDLPITGDIDGDGITDRIVIRRLENSIVLRWHIKFSSGGEETEKFGLRQDVPVVADFDGDGRDNIAVWRVASGTWYVLSGHSVDEQQFGLPGDLVAALDFDGDGQDDFAVFRPSTVSWFIRRSSDAETVEIKFGSAGDVVGTSADLLTHQAGTRGDYDGDRLSDLALLRASSSGELQWLFYQRGSESHPLNGQLFGERGDIIAPGDYDGDGLTDMASVRFENGNAIWRFRRSSSGYASANELTVQFGLANDQVVPGDYDGDGKTDLAVVRDMPNGIKLWMVSSSGIAPVSQVSWGLQNDLALTADIDGDRRNDFIVVRQINGELLWLIRTADGTTLAPRFFGFDTDRITVGDYDADGRDEIGVVRDLNGFKLIIIDGLDPFFWGLDGDTTLAAAYGGTMQLERAVWRVSDGQGSFIIRNSLGEAVDVPFGVSGDTPLRALGISFVGAGVSSTGSEGVSSANQAGVHLNCATRTNASAQESGFVWKPVSDSDGKLVVLFGKSRAGEIRNVALVEEGATGDSVIETLRFVGATNGGRPTFRAALSGRSYPSNVVLVRQDSNAANNCIVVANPGSRYQG